MSSFTKSTFVKKFTITFTIVTFAYLCACNKPNQFQNGDKIFLTGKLLKEKVNDFSVNVFQLIEPINGNGERYVIHSPWAISIDSLQKYSTANVGNFLKHVVLKLKRKNDYLPSNFYAFIPNKKIFIKTDHFNNILPAGYKYAHAPFYIFPILISPKETIIKN